MGNELTTLPASGNLNQKNVTLIGFPGSSKSPRVCPKTSTEAYAGRFLEIACAGFAPGASGGPFLRNVDGKRARTSSPVRARSMGETVLVLWEG